MKFITDYKELGGNQNASLLDYLEKEPIDNKEKILDYLKTGKDNGIRCSVVYDYVKDESMSETIKLFTDGEFNWDSEEIYHFEKYNLRLNEDFIKKVK